MELSKQPTLSKDERYLRDFSDVYMDSGIANVLEEMYTYNELLASEPVDSARINEIMRELDAKWSDHLDEWAHVTGELTLAPVGPYGIEGEGRTVYHEGRPMLFKGAMPAQLDTEIDKSEPQYYELRVQLIEYDIAEGEVAPYRLLVADVLPQAIISLEFPLLMMSRQRAQHWLEYYHAEDIAEIDTHLLNPSCDDWNMMQRL